MWYILIGSSWPVMTLSKREEDGEEEGGRWLNILVIFLSLSDYSPCRWLLFTHIYLSEEFVLQIIKKFFSTIFGYQKTPVAMLCTC